LAASVPTHFEFWRDPLPAAPATTFWGALNSTERHALADRGVTRDFAAGVALRAQGHASGSVHVLFAGQVEVYRLVRSGTRTVLGRRGPGDVLGEMAALDRQPALATVCALGRVVALVVPADQFLDFCADNGRVGLVLMSAVATRLRASDELRSQQRSDVRDRVIMALIELSAADPSAHGAVVLRLTQQDLADMVSASLVSVTRALLDLRRAGVLSTGRGQIVLHRADALPSLLAVE
jgi:CRP/FNR family transcriptional regulator, cyclic AMP receptor protein